MTIKHLVLGGGGAGGFTVYGALRYLNQQGIYSKENIESIYSSSAGSIIAALILLTDSWELLDDYILKRPWDKLITINPIDIFNLWQQKGIFNEEMVKSIIKPFLQAKDLDENITLKELYDINHIQLNFFTTNVNSINLETIKLSHVSHPNLTFCKAISMSAAFPMMFIPVYDCSNCYIDGGLLNNFPLNDCMEVNSNPEEILAIKIFSVPNSEKIDNNTLLPLYLYNIIFKMYSLLNGDNTHKIIPNIIECVIENNSLTRWANAVSDVKIRQEYIEIGEKNAKYFIEN